MKYVHRPILIQQSYEQTKLPVLRLLRDLVNIYHNLDINEDPYIRHLRANNATTQELQQAILKGKTHCKEELKSFVHTAEAVYKELGPWACEAYMLYSVRYFRAKKRDFMSYDNSLNEEETNYLLDIFGKLDTNPDFVGKEFEAHFVTAKVHMLVQILKAEAGTDFSGIVFVKTRAAVYVLKKLLEAHHSIRSRFRLGASVGTSNHDGRKAAISDALSRYKSNENLEEVLEDLRTRRKNILISTDVVEEGIDISACNTVICFDPPPNLKSFVQRRGRARDAKSKYFILFSKDLIRKEADRWHELEEEMRQKYMDDMRELGMINQIELADDADRIFEVPSTGAKLTFRDAVGHLHHFCNLLPRVQYASLAPLFIHDGQPDHENVTCRVILPNCVEQSVREFRSSRLWKSQRMAQMDAAFEAYVGLYHAGLINDHLLPVAMLSEEEDEMYRKIEKRPNVVAVEKQLNPSVLVAKAWASGTSISQITVVIHQSQDVQSKMRLLMPLFPETVEDLTLYLDAETYLTLFFESHQVSSYATEEIAQAESFTRTTLYSVFRSRMDPSKTGLLALFLPNSGTFPGDLSYIQQTSPATSLLELEQPFKAEIGLIRDLNGTPHIFNRIETLVMPPSTSDPNAEPRPLILATRLSKRSDFLHPVTAAGARKPLAPVLLDPAQCIVDNLPLSFSLFATLIPSITYHISNASTVSSFQTQLLSNEVFANRTRIPTSLLQTALSAPVARLDRDYQRQEFLGDAVFKFFAGITLMAAHPTWPEGYLAHSKDLVVSNKSAALAAKETGLEKYILRKQFTGVKWRPSYVQDILTQSETDARTSAGAGAEMEELSTKVLADVVEALIGAAYLSSDFYASSSGSGDESPVLDMLTYFTPPLCAAKSPTSPSRHNTPLSCPPSQLLIRRIRTPLSRTSSS